MCLLTKTGVHHRQVVLVGKPPNSEFATQQPPYGQPYNHLLNLTSDSIFICGLLRRQLIVTHRTRVSH